MAALTRVTAPDDDGPVDLDLFKAQARIDATDQDAYLTALLAAATQKLDGADGILNRALLTQTWELALDDWPGLPAWSRPSGGYDWPMAGRGYAGYGYGRQLGLIRLPLAPLQSVTSITYTDQIGAAQTWAADQYQVDARSEPGRVLPAYGVTLPILRGPPQVNQVVVRFVCGFGDRPADVPQPIRNAITLLAAHWYERRTPVEIVSGALVEIPMTVDWLLAPFRLRSFGREHA